MKRLSALVCVLIFGLHHTGYCQADLQSKVEEAFQYNVTTNATSLFSPIPENSKNIHADHLNYAESLQLSKESLNNIIAHPNTPLTLSIPFKGVVYDLKLVRNHIKSESYHLISDSEDEYLESYFYHGEITEKKGWATMSIIGGEVRLLIAHQGGNIEVHRDQGQYIAYENHDRKTPLAYLCETEEEIALPTSVKNNTSRAAADCLELYLECDFQSYLDNGSSVAQTEAWALSILNDVSTIYTIEGISLVVSSIMVHSSTDPYTALTNKADVRNAFVNQVQGNYDGRVAYLLSTRDLSGGISYGIGGFCADYPAFPGPYALATSLSSTIVPYPSYSFNTLVIAHELGHVLGSRHTHACVWNGNNTQIDDCGNSWAMLNGFTPEGTECYDDTTPILPATGTIMSYCDLVGGVGIDLANGFGSQPGALILDNYNNALCSTGGLCASIPPSNDHCPAAIELPLRTHCVFERFDNILATSSAPSSTTCGSPSNFDDVWFRFTAVGVQALLTVDPTASGGISDVMVIVYTGTCGNLTEYACGFVSGSNTLTLLIKSLTAGQNIFIRVISDNGTQGTFDICLSDPMAKCHLYEDELIDLYNTTAGASWTSNTGWGTTINAINCDVCDWYGITCDNQGNIIEIDLSFNNLSGTIPVSLGNIVTLTKIDLFSNSLSGIMPDVWGDMDDLAYFDLSANTFTGLIPRSIMGLSELTTLYLENNGLVDTLPKELGLLPNIDVMWLKNNNLTGCFPATFSNICGISSKNFVGNVGLPGGGDIIQYCLDGTGEDGDFDGFCKGTDVNDDCDDSNDTIYPGAPEICDGKDNNCDGSIDEGNVDTNTWTGGNGSWTDMANWSGGVPRACEDIVIDGNHTVSLSMASVGYARSVSLSSGAVLDIDGVLNVTGASISAMSIGIATTCTNTGTINIEDVSAIGFLINGVMNNSGQIFVENIGVEAEVVVENGMFDNTGGVITLGN